MEEKMLSKGFLLNEEGNLTEAGYATSLVKEYSRKHIKANSLRIKEWDYYFVGNNQFGIALTIADNSYLGFASVSFLDFENKSYLTKSVMTLMPKGKLNLPETSNYGDVIFKSKKLKISFLNDGSVRRLICHCKRFNKKEDFSCDIILKEDNLDSMVIAIPFPKPKHFYYNQKINNQRVQGGFKIGNKEYKFNSDAFGVLDWGRGVWTYKNTWYWSSMSAKINGVNIGFNFGYGFGDTSKASENMIFYNGKAYKVDQVEFIIPVNEKGKRQYLNTWKIKSNDGKVNLVFHPIIDRHDDTNIGIIKSLQHQVFGKFFGYVCIDEKRIEIKDLIGFAERVTNHW